MSAGGGGRLEKNGIPPRVVPSAASMAGDEQSLSLTIMRDSGTGEWRGIRGAATITIDADGGHTFILDYDLD